MKAKITPDNIKGFVQGWTRSLFSLTLPEYILEQVEYRATKAKECVEQGFCSHCGCKMPEKLYENRPCEKDPTCYPPMMNEEQWNKFKEVKETNDKTQTSS